jgi:hypothetical protein
MSYSDLLDILLEEEVITPADMRWVICYRCGGDGVLRGYAGVYTSDDFASGEVDIDDYLATRRACDDCGSTGKVHELTDEAAERPDVREWIDDYFDTLAIERAERWAGA